MGRGKTCDFRCVLRFGGILINIHISIFFFEDGVYRLIYMFETGQVLTHVWFSHSLIEGNSSTYVITECPENPKQAILSHIRVQSENQNIRTPLRPLEIDAYLSEQCLDTFRQQIGVLAHLLTHYVCQRSICRKFAENI